MRNPLTLEELEGTLEGFETCARRVLCHSGMDKDEHSGCTPAPADQDIER
jgi:hypothetical protein